MRLKLIYIVLAFSCYVTMVPAQAPGTKIFYLGTEYQEPPRINTIYQLQEGYILAGTTNGLYRFDGINFYQFPSNDGVPDTVTAVCELPDKNVLVGFSNGKIGRLLNNRVILDSFEEGFPKQPITKIISDGKQIIWVATAGEGLYFYKNNKLYNINTDDGLSDNFVYDISLLTDGQVLASTDRGINLCTADLKHKVIRHFTSRNGLPDNIVRCMYITPHHQVWVGMQDAGITNYNLENPDSTQKLNWTYGQVNAIMPVNGLVFVATEDYGLLVFGRNGDNEVTTLQAQDDRLKKATCMIRDHEGNVWVAGNNELLRSSASNVQPLITLNRETAENIHSICWSQDSCLWYNASGGVIRLKEEQGVWTTRKYLIPGISGESISSIFSDANRTIWIGTLGKGIFLLDPVTGKLRPLKSVPQLVNANIISITGSDTAIWISAFEGTVCAKLSGGDIRFINYSNVENLGNKYIYNILTDSRNRTWFATDGKGIIRYENGRFTNLPQPPNGYGNVVYKLAEDRRGNIWFSTYDKGLVKYDGKQFITYTTKSGLTDMNITALAISGDNLILIHKNNIDLVNTVTGNIVYIDEDQGIKNINTDLNALASDGAGNTYFVADTILYKYNPAKETVIRPLVTIDQVQLFLNDINVPNGHSFRYNQNNLSFFFTGLYYSQPNRIQYQYKLEGYDKDWINTKDRVRNFPQLRPGHYTFRVRASLNQNFASAYEAAFSFNIEKPFWLQAWFILLSVVAAASILYLFIRQRDRTIEKYNRLQREKIQSQLETLRNQINPHFLFNSFNTLISEIEEHPDNAVKYVEHLSDFYRSIVVHREKDFISLEEEIHILNDYGFIQRKRYGSALEIEICITEEQKRKYYIVPLALQLLFENAVKHNAISPDMPLRIEVAVDREEYLTIRNNINKKFSPEKGSGMGLQNIRKRYELLVGRPVIVEQDDKFFKVKIPLIKYDADKSIDH